MIPDMNLEEQVDSDFSRARRRAFLKRIMARLRNDLASNQLLSFDEVRRVLLASNQSYLGMRTVEVEEIVGSVGRQREFDRSFMPTRASGAARWKRIDRAFHGTEELPPVSLYKIQDRYFVLDGHHRVSVARYHGVETIDAEVVELRPKARTAICEVPRAGRATQRSARNMFPSPNHPRLRERPGDATVWRESSMP